MAKIAILYCKRIKDHSCLACAKCFKGIAEKAGKFAQHDEIELFGMTGCGDCPGLAAPRVKLLKETARGLARDFDTIHFGTGVKMAMETAQCPVDFDSLKALPGNRFGVRVILGTHSYQASFSMTASVNSRVVAPPPTSRVRYLPSR